MTTLSLSLPDHLADTNDDDATLDAEIARLTAASDFGGKMHPLSKRDDLLCPK